MSIDRQIDEIFDRIDDNFLDGNFDAVNEELKIIKVKELHTDLLIAYLTISTSTHQKLAYWPIFYELIEQELKIRKETKEKWRTPKVEDLLGGFKSIYELYKK